MHKKKTIHCWSWFGDAVAPQVSSPGELCPQAGYGRMEIMEESGSAARLSESSVGQPR